MLYGLLTHLVSNLPVATSVQAFVRTAPESVLGNGIGRVSALLPGAAVNGFPLRKINGSLGVINQAFKFNNFHLLFLICEFTGNDNFISKLSDWNIVCNNPFAKLVLYIIIQGYRRVGLHFPVDNANGFVGYRIAMGLFMYQIKCLEVECQLFQLIADSLPKQTAFDPPLELQ